MREVRVPAAAADSPTTIAASGRPRWRRESNALGQMTRWVIAAGAGIALGAVTGRPGELRDVSWMLVALAVLLGLLALWSP